LFTGLKEVQKEQKPRKRGQRGSGIEGKFKVCEGEEPAFTEVVVTGKSSNIDTKEVP